jgi:hypothetical protein
MCAVGLRLSAVKRAHQRKKSMLVQFVHKQCRTVTLLRSIRMLHSHQRVLCCSAVVVGLTPAAGH